MAKKPETTEKSGIKNVLLKRVNITKSKGLGRDIKAPRWLRAIGGYFKGSWNELREVRWPNRRATWSLSLAVILFTLVLVIFIVAIDYGFEQLFKNVILR